MRSSSPVPRGDMRYWPMKPSDMQTYISSSTGRNLPGLSRICFSRSKNRAPLRTSWWNVDTSERASQPPPLPHGVASTTSSMLAHSA